MDRGKATASATKNQPWLTNPAGKVLYGIFGFFLGMAGGFLFGMTGVRDTEPIPVVYYAIMFAFGGAIFMGLFFAILASLPAGTAQTISRFVEFVGLFGMSAPPVKLTAIIGPGWASGVLQWLVYLCVLMVFFSIVEIVAARITKPLLRLLNEAHL